MHFFPSLAVSSRQFYFKISKRYAQVRYFNEFPYEKNHKFSFFFVIIIYKKNTFVILSCFFATLNMKIKRFVINIYISKYYVVYFK